MKIVVIKNYDKLGKIGDVKNVPNGYAENFLIPNQIVLPATGNNIDRAMKLKVQKTQQKKSKNVDKKELAMNLNNYTLSVKEKADENGTLFAGITRDKIAAELKSKGYDVKAKQVKLDSPVKKAGSKKVKINIDSGLQVVVNLDVQIG